MNTEALDIAQKTICDRLRHTRRAQAYLDYMSDAMVMLQEVMAHNQAGEFTYALRALAAYLDRLRQDARTCVVKAQGFDDDQVPF